MGKMTILLDIRTEPLLIQMILDVSIIKPVVLMYPTIKLFEKFKF